MNESERDAGAIPPLLAPLSRNWDRIDRVTQQLSALDALPRRERLARMRSAEYLRTLAPETLVTVVRWLKRNGYQSEAAPAFSAIIALIEPMIAQYARRIANEPQLQQRIEEDTLSRIIEVIWGADEKDGFWEANFRICMQRTAMKVHQRHARQMDKEEPLEWTSDDGESVERPDLAVVDDPLAGIEKERIQRAIGELTEHERRAITLQYFEGLDVETRGSDKYSISTIMKKSGRMVRNYLNSGRLKLAESLKDLANE